MRERTGAAFSASGETMHACGHDVHMAALVALARAAHTLAGELPAPLLAVFQPSEEAYPSGAEQLAGRAARAPRPRAIVAAHVHPELPWGAVGARPGHRQRLVRRLRDHRRGRAHPRRLPACGRDPILALAQVVVALHAQAGRRSIRCTRRR